MVLVEDITKITEEEWLNYRRLGIGGSDAAKVLGLSSFATPIELYWDKIGEKDYKPKEETFVAKEVGHLLEPLVAKIFESKNPGWKVYKDNRMITHPVYTFMLADIDYYTIDPNTGEKYIVECKTTNSDSLDRTWGKANDNRFPVTYEWQCRHYMAVHEIAGTILICLGGNNEDSYRQRVVMRDLDKEKYLIEEERKFWEEHVVPRIPPKATNPLPVAKHFAPQASKLFSTPLITAYNALEEKKNKIEKALKEVTEQQDEIEAEILLALAGASGNITDGNVTYEVKETKRTTTAIKASKLPNLKLEYPEVYDKYVETTVNITTKLKKK